MTAKIILAKEQLKDLAQSYQNGESVKSLSERLGFSRTVINRILKNNGFEIRGRSEAEILKWKEIKKDLKKINRQCGNAWIHSPTTSTFI